MTIDTSRLAALLEGKGHTVWTPPALDDFGYGRVVAFDQSLSATGRVFVQRGEGFFRIYDASTFAGNPQDPETTGREKDLQRGVDLWARFSGDFRSMAGDVVIVHEAPALGGGGMRTPESSLLAAQALRIAAAQHRREVVMIQTQQHRKLVCGDAKAKKREEQAAALKLAESIGITGTEKITNASKRDAFCLALAYLLLLGRAQKENGSGIR